MAKKKPMEVKFDARTFAARMGLALAGVDSARNRGAEITAQDGEMRIAIIDSSVMFDVGCPCETLSKGSALVPSKLLYAVVRACANGDVTLAMCGKDAVITDSEGAEWSLHTYTDKGMFPQMDEDPEVHCAINASELQAVAKNVATACSSNEHRPVLTGLLMQYNKSDGLAITATDSYLLLWAKINQVRWVKASSRIGVLPVGIIDGLAAAKVSEDSEIGIGIGKKIVRFKFALDDGCSVIAKAAMIAADFPAWEHLAEATSTASVLRVDRDMMLQAVQKASVLPTPEARITLSASPESDRLIVELKSADVGGAVVDIPASCEEGPVNAGNNARHLSHLLNAHTPGEITFLWQIAEGSLKSGLVEWEFGIGAMGAVLAPFNPDTPE